MLLNEQRQREWSTTIMACNSAIQAADLTYALHLHSAARQATNCTLLLHMHACSCTGSCRRLCLCAESTPRIFCWAKEESHMQKREREVLQMRCMQRIAMHIHVLLDLLRQKRSLTCCCCCIAPWSKITLQK